MKRLSLLAITIATLLFGFDSAQAQTLDKENDNATKTGEFQLSNFLAQARLSRLQPFSLLPLSSNLNASPSTFTLTQKAAGPSKAVAGSGTLGRLTKWSGFTSTNSFIGDSTIFENKFGMVGIGTDSPASRLTVAGMIQSLSGGFKFPDGTVQTTSAIGSLFTVAHDATLAGDGTAAMPLGVAVPLVLSGDVPAPGVLFSATNATGAGISGDGATVGVLGSGNNVGLLGQSNTGIGVFGSSMAATGVRGSSVFGTGVGGEGQIGVSGSSDSGDGIGVRGSGATGVQGSSLAGLAGDFNGNVDVSLTLTKGGGSFKIDHPLDPENRYLYHSFVESPDMMNVYNGNVTTDLHGEAVVTLPDYFQALNKDFRYQLTVIGQFAQAIVGEEINNNRFTIKTDRPGVRVSWQVTGIRKDAWAEKNRIQVEVEKKERERGFYLHPEAFDQPEERGLLYLKDPELMKQMKEAREKMKLNQQ